MDWFRYSRDVYGREVLEGANFDLIWYFVGAAAVIIVAHFILSALSGRKKRD